jgi:tetratricopeptide (TPR) repeat protein
VEEWLTADGPVDGTYRVRGLDPQASSTLVQRILERHGADLYLHDPQERQALSDLITLLGGYPLALTVVITVLATAAPSAVLADLQAGGTGADPAGVITAAIEYSYGKLDPIVQNSLLLLAPFTGVIPLGPPLDGYQDAISADPAVQRLGTIDLAAAVKHTVRVGLAGPYPRHTGFVQVQPLLPYFLRGKLRDSQELRRATDGWHYGLYLNQSDGAIDMLDAQDDPDRRLDGLAIVRAEYANFKAALDYGLREGGRIGPIVEVLEEYLDQSEQPTARRALIDDAIAAHVTPRNRRQVAGLASLHGLASVIALQEHRLADARRHCDTSLPLYQALYQASGSTKELYAALRQLSQVAHREGDLSSAREASEEALRLATQAADKAKMASCRLALADVATDEEEFGAAKSHYQEAITIYTELGQRHAVGNCLLNFAAAAYTQGEFAEAESAYRQASEVYAAFEDNRGVASATYALGELAEKRNDLDKAEALYRRALELYYRFSDQAAVATVFLNLGSVASKRGRLAEAAANFGKALETYLAAGLPGAGAGVCSKLAVVSEKQGLPAEQEAHLQQAAALAREADDPGGAATVYAGLSMLALALGRPDQAVIDQRTAASLFRQAGNEEAATKWERGFHEIADLVTAAERKLPSPAASEAAGDLAAVGRYHHDHAKLAERLKELGVALADYRQARDAFEAVGDAAGAADAYYHIGVFAMRNHDYHEAGENFARSASLHLEAGERELAAYRYDGVGLCAQQIGQPAKAEAAFRHALEIRLEIGDEAGAAQSRYGLAVTALEQDHLDDAVTDFNAALDYYRATDEARAAQILTRLGWIATIQHRHAAAEGHYNEAERLAQENGSSPDSLVTAYGLATAADGLGQAGRAVELYQRALRLAQEMGNDAITDLISSRLVELDTGDA